MDQIANMLNGIKTASFVKKDHIFVPHSKIKVSILELLKKEGFIYDYNKDAYFSPKIMYEWSVKKWNQKAIKYTEK